MSLLGINLWFKMKFGEPPRSILGFHKLLAAIYVGVQPQNPSRFWAHAVCHAFASGSLVCPDRSRRGRVPGQGVLQPAASGDSPAA